MTLRFGIEGDWFEWDNGGAAEILDEQVTKWIRESVESVRAQATKGVPRPYSFCRSGNRTVFARLADGRIEVNVLGSMASLDFLAEED